MLQILRKSTDEFLMPEEAEGNAKIIRCFDGTYKASEASEPLVDN